ncbi:MAG: ferredoxin [Coriobacteriales bacterium]|nr:ferredoxin [Coriobacteriales bacterium]
MKATVNEDCIGCGMCESTAADVFAINDDGIAEVIVDEIPEDVEDDVQDAADSCPVSAIEVE